MEAFFIAQIFGHLNYYPYLCYMKNVLIIIAVISILTSCKKEETYMFKAFHHIQGSDTIDCFGVKHSRITSDYFQFPEANKTKAEAHYLEKMANNPQWDLMEPTDSTWVEYYCTTTEWEAKSI